MSKKVAIPLMLVSLGIFVATQNIGCGDSGGGGTGGAAGSSAGGKGGTGTAGTTGTGGKGGTAGTGTAGTTGTGGKGGTAGTGTAGTTGTGGTAGTAGTGAGGTAGARDGGTDTTSTPDATTDTVVTDAGSDANLGLQRAATLCPSYPNTPPDAGYSMPPMTAADFCQIYTSLCASPARDGSAPRYATYADCLLGYSGMQDAGNTNYGTKQMCESVHVCNGYANGNPTTAGLNLHCQHAEGTLAPCAP